MRDLQRLLEAEIARLPHQLLEAKIKKKLRAKRARVPADFAAKMATHLLSDDEAPFRYDDGKVGKPRKVSISFTDRDAKRVLKTLEAFTDKGLGEMIGELSESGAKELFKTLSANWPEHRSFEAADQKGFRDRLEMRWGKGLDNLRMLLAMVREVGAERAKKRMRRNAKASPRKDVLVRFHARMCQVTAEVLCLLENGFADAAMARWRTMHEIHVVGTLIAENDDAFAVRFLQHEAVEAKKAMAEYQAGHKALGFAPPSARDVAQTHSAYDAVIKQYGPEFKEQYGWAAALVKNKRPTFVDLERAADKAAMRSYYKMASYGVHSSPKSLFNSLGSLGSDLLLAGASDAGLVEPGQNAAITLMQMTILVFEEPYALDDIVIMKVMQHFVDASIKGFVASNRKLERFAKSRVTTVRPKSRNR